MKRVTFYVRTPVVTFWASFRENMATFYSNIWSHWSRSTCTLNVFQNRNRVEEEEETRDEEVQAQEGARGDEREEEVG